MYSDDSERLLTVEMEFIHPQNDLPSLPPEPRITAGNRKVLAYIETTFNNILREIQTRPCGKPVIVIRRIASVRPYHDGSDFNRLKWHIEDREVIYSFPAKTKDEAWRFGEAMKGRHWQILMCISVRRADSECDILSNQGWSHNHQKVHLVKTGTNGSLTKAGTSTTKIQRSSSSKKPSTGTLTTSPIPAW